MHFSFFELTQTVQSHTADAAEAGACIVSNTGADQAMAAPVPMRLSALLREMPPVPTSSVPITGPAPA